MVSSLIGHRKVFLGLLDKGDGVKLEGVSDFTASKTELSIRKLFNAIYCLRIYSGSLFIIAY